MKWYVTYYEEYPIYESAEGGYYYAGNKVVWAKEFSSRKKALRFCKKAIMEKYNELLPYEQERTEIKSDKTGMFYTSKYIGEGWSLVLEREQGNDVFGCVPYC